MTAAASCQIPYTGATWNRCRKPPEFTITCPERPEHACTHDVCAYHLPGMLRLLERTAPHDGGPPGFTVARRWTAARPVVKPAAHQLP